MERVQLCACSCYWDTRLWLCQFCHFSLLPQILSVIQSLPNLHSSSSHFSELMGKCNLHVKVKRLYEVQMLKMLLQSWGSPREGKKRSKEKRETCLDLYKTRGTFSLNFLKSRLWQGRWRIQSCETGLKISYLHYFPNGTVFNYILLVTLGWHICVYFVLWFSWDDLIMQKIGRLFMSNQMAVWLTHSQAF